MAHDRGPLSGILAALLLAWGWPGAASADPGPPGTFDVEVKDPLVRVRAELDLVINGSRGGTVFVLLEAGDCLVRRGDLEAAGLRAKGGEQRLIDDVALLSLQSLAPEIAFQVDEPNLALRITAPPERLARQTLDLRATHRPPGLEVGSAPSAFLDYAVDGDSERRFGAALEAGARHGAWLARSGFSGRNDLGWARGLTSAVRDDVPTMTRLTIGDTAASGGALGGALLLGGVSFAREYALDPYFVRGAYPATSTVVSTPSTMEVYVNGTLLRRQPVNPGFWDLSNIPAAAGQSLVRTVVRDAFGNERVLDSSFYYSAGVLAPGLTDFAAAAGFTREELGLSSFSYGKPAALARYRLGLRDWFTPGARLELSPDLLSAGVTGTGASRVGEFEGALGLSAAEGEAGVAAQASWLFHRGPWSAGLRLGAESPHYANLSRSPVADRPLLDVRATGGARLSRHLSLSAELAAGRWRDRGAEGSAALRAAIALRQGASLVLSIDYGRAAGADSGLQAMALLVWSLSPRHTADVMTTRARDGTMQAVASTTRAISRATGWGYRLRAGIVERADPALDAVFQAQAEYGLAELQLTQDDGGRRANGRASGGLIYVDRVVDLARPTGGSFALVRTGIPGIGVAVENNDVGRTGPAGTLMVTGLLPYHATRLQLREADVPLEYDAGDTTRFVAAPERGAALVDFDLQRISAVSGTLAVRIGGAVSRPANGEVSTIVDGELRGSPITPEGRFFLERLPVGRHVLQAIWREGSCRAVVTVPPNAQPVLEVGEVKCYLDALGPDGRIPRLDDPSYADRPFPEEPRTGAGGGGGGDGQ